MDGNSSIDLDERTDGNIICSVTNHISHAQKTIRLEPCPCEISYFHLQISTTPRVIDLLIAVFALFSVCGVCAGLVFPADGSFGSVRSFSHLHETHVR